MQHDEVQRAFGSRGTPKRGWRCQSDENLAAFVDGNLPGYQQVRVREHLARCEFCREHVSALVRLSGRSLPEVSPDLIAKAARLAGANGAERRRPVWRWAAPLAAAACVGLALVPAVRQGRLPAPQDAPPASTVVPEVKAPEAPMVRRIPADGGFELIEPQENAVVPQANLEFRWNALTGSLSYQVRVLNAAGDVKWESAPLENPQARLPRTAALPAGQYYAIVTANMADGKTVRAPALKFEIAAGN